MLVPSSASGRMVRTGHRATWTAIAGVTALVSVVAAACSSTGVTTTPAKNISPAGGLAAAKSAIAPYTVVPTTFPVGDPLAAALPAGKKFVYLQCGTPICALAGSFIQQAVKEIGGDYYTIDAGSIAQTAQAAADSALSVKPDAVLIGAIDPALFGNGLKALSAAGVKVVSLEVDKKVKPDGITFNYLGTELSERNGRLLADWVIAKKGTQADAVLYTLPALDISAPMQDAFEAEMKTNCPSCTVRVIPLDANTIGTSAPRTVVTDLRAHKDADAAVFVALAAADGLPAALKAAGLSITTVGFGPTAGTLQDIKDGTLAAALNIDYQVSTWTAVDAAARLIEGGAPTASEQAGDAPEQFLEQKDITFDPTRGWSAFPDCAQRFAQLWRMS